MILIEYVKPYVKNGIVFIHRQTGNPNSIYEIPLDHVSTLSDLVLKQIFMKEKSWYTDQMNDDLFEVVVYANGLQH